MKYSSSATLHFLFNFTDRPDVSRAGKRNVTFCVNYFDTGAYHCSDCQKIPSAVLTFARVEFALALLVILINVGEIFVIVRLLLKIKRESISQNLTLIGLGVSERKYTSLTKWASSPMSFDPLTLCTFAVCDCLLGEGYFLEIACLFFTGASSKPICKWADRVGVFLIKFGGIYMPTALLNEACIKRLIVYFRPYSHQSDGSGERAYASPRFVGVSWAFCLFVCFLDTAVQAVDEEAYDVYYSLIKYCLLGLDGIFYLAASLMFVCRANRRRLTSRNRRLRYRRSHSPSMVYESRARWRARCVWNANFAVQFFIFFVCISIFLSVNVFWFCQELTHRLDATDESNCLVLLVVYKLTGLTFGLGKPFIFFLGLRTIRRFDDGQISNGASLRTVSEDSATSPPRSVEVEDEPGVGSPV